ncbi:MAG: hypothetical protein IJK72_00945, partial [Mycoplasma sp.]|nr:hypothetical protein [Mycoplasma sp.]
MSAKNYIHYVDIFLFITVIYRIWLAEYQLKFLRGILLIKFITLWSSSFETKLKSVPFFHILRIIP